MTLARTEADDNKTPASPAAPATDPKKPDAKKPATGPKPYKEVITADAKSDTGLFTVHRLDDKVFWEIPAAMLNRDMLWQTEIEQVGAGHGYSGVSAGSHVVQWTRRNNKIYLRMVDFTLRTQEKGALRTAIDEASLDPILMAFDVMAEGTDKSAVIDVTSLLSTDNAEFGAGRSLGASGLDASRSYIDTVKPFPTNIESKVMMTFSNGGGGDPLSALVHYSLDLLPETPMKGRLFDSRVGFFNEGFQDYDGTDHRVMERAYITRYRLEKKDPAAAVSDPVKPIVYYISREVPEKWHPYLKKAVEAWQVAFEQAGFKNAIICKDAPTLEEDPNWDPEDARYSVIRWAPTETENAMGPHVHDPRSGEIISAHIIVWHNVLKLAEDWYFTQVSALDPRAQKIPLPDSLMGEILEYVVCHEVGHTLGLQHNFKGSSSYT
ncbi:MAG: DUF5117 domain-containing protein, partial [Chloroflexi bacterium]|nr:DUF5117 domain-containing protein [Chloroflexota bacterium]